MTIALKDELCLKSSNKIQIDFLQKMHIAHLVPINMITREIIVQIKFFFLLNIFLKIKKAWRPHFQYIKIVDS